MEDIRFESPIIYQPPILIELFPFPVFLSFRPAALILDGPAEMIRHPIPRSLIPHPLALILFLFIPVETHTRTIPLAILDGTLIPRNIVYIKHDSILINLPSLPNPFEFPIPSFQIKASPISIPQPLIELPLVYQKPRVIIKFP